ncbi:MAG TPA: universal stress protein [Azospira sp.]|nr:universal stress protein [Azospira sp.]
MNDKLETRTERPDLRILIPVAFGSHEENGVRYALAEAGRGRRVEAVLACIGDDDVRADVLRLRTREEIARFQAAGAAVAMDEVAAPLRAAQVPVSTVFALGEVAGELARIAEETGCDEIAIPAGRGGPACCGGRLDKLRRAGGQVRLRAVDADGKPQPAVA